MSREGGGIYFVARLGTVRQRISAFDGIPPPGAGMQAKTISDDAKSPQYCSLPTFRSSDRSVPFPFPPKQRRPPADLGQGPLITSEQKPLGRDELGDNPRLATGSAGGRRSEGRTSD